MRNEAVDARNFELNQFTQKDACVCCRALEVCEHLRLNGRPMWMKRLLLLLCATCVSVLANPTPIKPTSADGKPLNLDFETAPLKDWTAEVDAFHNQPIHGDTVQPRRADMR